MDDGISIGSNSSSSKMGASGNPNTARLSTLQERKKVIEEILAKKNQELKQLCIQEAELTGIMPPEIPLEPGEIPPSFRKRVGTSFQLPQNLLNNINNEEESIDKLELEMQIQAKLADAAFLLADDRNISKTVRRKHKAEYEKHKKQYEAYQEQLQFLKTTVQATQNNVQQKQKKKPRPLEKDDTVSMHTNLSEPLGKSTLRHSMRSLQHPILSDSSDQREYPKLLATYSNSNPHCNTVTPYMTHNINMFYRLTLNDYKNYVERRENIELTDNIPQSGYMSYTNSYQTPSNSQYNTLIGNSPNHILQRTTSNSNNYPNTYHYGTLQQQPHLQDCNKSKLSLNTSQAGHIQRQSTGLNSLPNHKNYYPPTPTYRQYPSEQQQYHTLNPHQLQPHQQYEHVMTTGLGGVWKKSETGEMVWCNSSPNVESTWQGDKVFGSLDRRRNKRIHKKLSPSAEGKPDTTHGYERMRHIPSAKPQILCRRQEKLVRTQSLGSVGVQTADSVWPSDDNSSCEIDVPHNDIGSMSRKPKQKEWYESSLDGPAFSQVPILQSVLAPEEKYSPPPPPLLSISAVATPPNSKPILEIPAESNPSPRIHETNIEMFNNNMPKNCTIVHPGQCKPYHEETKPFEMSDFYKYSTKFKKTQKPENNSPNASRNWSPNHSKTNARQQNSELTPDNIDDLVQKVIYQPLQPMKCQPFSPVNNLQESQSPRNLGSPGSLNASLDLSQLTPNVAEKFSAEMNAWYQNHENQIDNNNTVVPASKIRSTATLV